MISWLSFCLLACAVVDDGTKLSGTIRDESGNPIVGATVSIYTAKPRVGVGTICPSCYTDCQKYTRTDTSGQFSIDNLDSELVFTVLVMAPGRRASLTDHLDPLATTLDLKLEPYPTNLPPMRALVGRVVGPDGKPIAGAVVSAMGAKTPERHLFGLLPDVDRAAVSDAAGRFMLTTQEPKLGLDVRVYAPGFAVLASQHFELHNPAPEIQLMLGASVSGKLTYEGQPVRNRAIGIVQQSRSAFNFVRDRVVATNEHGQFEFTDLQPNENYVLYTICQTSDHETDNRPDRPVLKTYELSTPYSGKSKDVGELPLIPSISFAGKIVVTSGQPLPPSVTVRLHRDPAWDWCETTVRENGEFEFYGLPPEVYEVSLIAPGFDIDPAKSRYQLTGPNKFGMRLKKDHDASKRIDIPLRSFE